MQNQLLVCISCAVAVGLTFISGANGLFLVKITSPDLNKDEISINSSTQLVLNCSVTSGGPAKFFLWKKDGKIIKRSNPGVVQYWSVVSKFNLGENDAGIYECLAGDGSEEYTDRLTLRVNCKPSILYEDGKHTTTPQLVTVGEKKTFHCRAGGRPKPRFRWLKDGVQIKERKYFREFQKEKDGVDLRFGIGMVKSDSGIYTCEATNIFGMSNYNISVYVKDERPSSKPVVEAGKRKMTSSVSSSNVTLVCSGEFTLEQLTQVHWVFNNTFIGSDKPGSRVFHKNHFYKRGSTWRVKMSLIIQNVTLADSGNYTCIATTPSGSDRDFVYLRVKKEKRIRPSVNYYWTIVAIVAVVVGIVVAVLLLLWFRSYRQRSQYAMVCEKYDVDGKEYEYDAFVTYSSHNCQWVESNVVSFLEKNNLKCCIHHRNFEPGKCITENMAESVYSSRKVIVVLSKYYMESGFCKEELNFALYRSLEKGHRCIIVIRIDDISIKRLPKSLRSKTFIDLHNSQEQATWHKKLLEYVQAPAEMTSKQPFEQESSNHQDSNANVNC